MSSWPMRSASPRFSSALIAVALAGCERGADRSAPAPADAPATASAASPGAAAASATPTSDVSAKAKAGAAPSPTGSVLFVSERDGRPAIYRVAASGGAVERLAAGERALYPAPVGPGGQVLAVASEGEQGPESLGLVEGGAFRAFGPSSRHLRNPAWYPDGAHVAFEADLESFRDVYRIAIGGGPPERITRCAKGCFEPDVHPDGKRLVYASSDDGDPEIHLREADGSTKRLTHSAGHDGTPRFSPDGRRVAFLSARKGELRVFVMGAEGQSPRMVSPDPHADSLGERDHAWSPDGTKLAFVEQLPKSRSRLYVVDVASGVAVGVTDGEQIDEAPAWSPDGQWIAFTSNRNGQTEIYLMQPDGAGLRRLTDHPAADWLPRWAGAAAKAR